jgi:hypothetical protein
MQFFVYNKNLLLYQKISIRQSLKIIYNIVIFILIIILCLLLFKVLLIKLLIQILIVLKQKLLKTNIINKLNFNSNKLIYSILILELNKSSSLMK